ncbi:glycosyltransferase [Paenibacillus sp. FSL H7-0714]|uniref:glycosyltransferase n=1 Tax=Paenibacillus sp. FSL H7-0714 TaxID=2954735 RepID=UPI0030F947AA
MRTYIFVRNKKYRPSTYYRIYQYIDESIEVNCKIIEYESNLFYEVKAKNRIINLIYLILFSFIPGYFRRIIALLKISTVNAPYKVFVQRECFPRTITPLGKLLLGRAIRRADKVYWDFDDNIFDAKEISKFEGKLLNKYADLVIVGNRFLESKVKENKNILVLNTTDKMMENIHLENINEERKRKFNDELILVWVGTKSNLIFLEQIIIELDKAAMKIPNKKVILRVISDRELGVKTKYLIVDNIKWSRSLAFSEMLKSHIGIMPLSENKLTLGKCAFKAVQAIGCGLPVIVSNVGMNKDVVTKGNGILINTKTEWVDAIVSLGSEVDIWEGYSIRSRELWLENFNSKKIQKYILNKLF